MITLSVNGRYSPNESITVSFDMRSANYTPGSCWIGLIPNTITSTSETVNDAHDVDYFYVSHNKKGQGTLRTSRIGTYVIRCFANDNGGQYLGCIDGNISVRQNNTEESKSNDEIEKLRKELFECRNIINKQKQSLNQFEKNLQEANKKLSQMQKENERSRQENQDLRNENSSLLKEKKASKIEIEKLKEEVLQSNAKRREEEQKYNKEIRKLQNKIKKMKADRKARKAADNKRKKAERARQKTMEKAILYAKQRYKKLAERAARRRTVVVMQSREMVQLQRRDQEAERQRQLIADESRRKRMYESKIVELKTALQRQEYEHKKKMMDMVEKAKSQHANDKRQQTKNHIQRMREAVSVVDKQIEQDTDELVDIVGEQKEIEEKLANLNNDIDNFNKDNDPEYKKWKDEMERALEIYQRDDDEISAAIDKTGQNENGVGRFLKLIHALIGQTMASQDQANKLDAELHMFQILILRECQDKLTIKHLFNSKELNRFVPILAEQNYTECHQLICENEEEFKGNILSVIEIKTNKSIDKADPFDAFLSHYKLTKYKQDITDMGLLSLDDINEDLDNETIKEIIFKVGITGLDKKRFKQAINGVKTGTYVPDRSEHVNEDQDDIKSDKIKEVSKMELRLLRNICLNPTDWQELEKEKATMTKLSLIEMSPVFVDFFDRMYDVVQKAQNLLSYDTKLNDDQSKVMKALMDDAGANMNDDSKTNDKGDPEKLPDYDSRKSWREGFQCQVYSRTKNAWYDGEIVSTANDSEGEWLHIKYNIGGYPKTKKVDRYGPDIRDPIMIECNAIAAAIDVDINVTELMMEEFEVSVTTLRVLPIARGVQQAAKSILLCQSQIRQSLRLAVSILQLKPAQLSDESKPLWDAVDNAITHIINRFLEMNKISKQYFGYFSRFNRSFKRFISMYNEDNNVTLAISLENVKEDIKGFIEFREKFNIKLQQLSDESMQAIKICVANDVGIEQFELTQAAREKAKEDYLTKKAKYDVESIRLDHDLEALKNERARYQEEEAPLKFRMVRLERRKEDNHAFKKSWLKEIDELVESNLV